MIKPDTLAMGKGLPYLVMIKSVVKTKLQIEGLEIRQPQSIIRHGGAIIQPGRVIIRQRMHQLTSPLTSLANYLLPASQLHTVNHPI